LILINPSTALLFWGYIFSNGAGAGNEAKRFSLQFRDVNNALIGPFEFLSVDAPIEVNSRSFSFPRRQGVRTIQVSLIDNHLEDLNSSGGDRVGLSEVRFLLNSTAITGDYNLDGSFGACDLDSFQSLRADSPDDPSLDVDQNGLIEDEDFIALLNKFINAGGTQITVDTVVDENSSPTGTDISLREALSSATASPGIYIDFSDFLSTNTLNLTLGALNILTDTEVFIDASSISGGITLDPASLHRIIAVENGAKAILKNLILTNGKAPDGITVTGPPNDIVGNDGEGGGAIFNEGALTLTECTLSNNQSGDGGDAPSNVGKGGNGGAIYNNGVLTLQTISSSRNALFPEIRLAPYLITAMVAMEELYIIYQEPESTTLSSKEIKRRMAVLSSPLVWESIRSRTVCSRETELSHKVGDSTSTPRILT